VAVTVCTMGSSEEVQGLAGRKRLLIIYVWVGRGLQNVNTLCVRLINISATTGKLVTKYSL